MSELDVIQRTPAPVTTASLIADLRSLGVREGMVVIAHTSMSALGWVVGGAQSVIEALLASVGRGGTMVIPAFSGGNSEPTHWSRPPVPEAWWPQVRAHMPAFDPRKTPTRALGAVAEAFRTWPGVGRSDHPAMSFCAFGHQAELILRDHTLASGTGDGSPLARIYELGGYVLLLGVSHASNTSLHLSANRADYPGKCMERYGAAMIVEGQRHWVEYDDLDCTSDDFASCGEAFDALGPVRTGRVGSADARLMPQRALVDFGVNWLCSNRC